MMTISGLLYSPVPAGVSAQGLIYSVAVVVPLRDVTHSPAGSNVWMYMAGPGRISTAVYRTIDKPTIAAVNGVAAGAGMSIALACDLRVGTENTRFKTVFIERSLSPDTGMSYFLPRIVGYSRACDLVFSSRYVEADEAYRIGLLDRLVPVYNLLEEAVELANQIAFWPPVAMQSARRVLQQSMESSFDQQLRNEQWGLDFARKAPHDGQESRESFRDRRPPKFTGQ